MKILVASALIVVLAALQATAAAIAEEFAPPAEYVPPIPADVLPPDSALAQQAIAVARTALQRPAARAARFKGTVIQTPIWIEVRFADPDACQPPCPDDGGRDCGVVMQVQLDKDATRVVRSYSVRDVQCPTL